MSLLQDLFSKNLVSLTKEQLKGATNIIEYAFYKQNLLTSVEIPDSVVNIGCYAFSGCSSLKKIVFGKNTSNIEMSCFDDCALLEDVDTAKMNNPYCYISGSSCLTETPWYNNQPEGSMVTIANGQILIGNKISTPSAGFEIPATVKTLAGKSCALYGSTVDANFTHAIVPDTIEMTQGIVFYGHKNLTQITIGSNVHTMTSEFHDPANTTSLTSVIFRQPAGMVVNLPESGLFDTKSSCSLNIYTDNEYIRNYDWAGDNITATFYPLSEATS